jgi:glucosinolate gamma-glutamyl hydrolase
MLEIHRDQVRRLPPGAVLLARSASTPVEMFAIGPRILCVQGHPEFTSDLLRGLIETRRAATTLPDTVAHSALHTLQSGAPDIADLVAALTIVLKQE